MYCQVGKHSALPFFAFQRLSVYQLGVGHLLCVVVNPTGRHNCKEGGMEEHVWGEVVVTKGLQGRVKVQEQMEPPFYPAACMRRAPPLQGGMEGHVWGVVVLIKGLKGRVEVQGKDGATCNLSSNQQGGTTAGRQGRCVGGGAGLEAGWRCTTTWHLVVSKLGNMG